MDYKRTENYFKEKDRSNGKVNKKQRANSELSHIDENEKIDVETFSKLIYGWELKALEEEIINESDNSSRKHKLDLYNKIQENYQNLVSETKQKYCVVEDNEENIKMICGDKSVKKLDTKFWEEVCKNSKQKSRNNAPSNKIETMKEVFESRDIENTIDVPTQKIRKNILMFEKQAKENLRVVSQARLSKKNSLETHSEFPPNSLQEPLNIKSRVHRDLKDQFTSDNNLKQSLHPINVNKMRKSENMIHDGNNYESKNYIDGKDLFIENDTNELRYYPKIKNFDCQEVNDHFNVNFNDSESGVESVHQYSKGSSTFETLTNSFEKSDNKFCLQNFNKSSPSENFLKQEKKLLECGFKSIDNSMSDTISESNINVEPQNSQTSSQPYFSASFANSFLMTNVHTKNEFETDELENGTMLNNKIYCGNILFNCHNKDNKATEINNGAYESPKLPQNFETLKHLKPSKRFTSDTSVISRDQKSQFRNQNSFESCHSEDEIQRQHNACGNDNTFRTYNSNKRDAYVDNPINDLQEFIECQDFTNLKPCNNLNERNFSESFKLENFNQKESRCNKSAKSCSFKKIYKHANFPEKPINIANTVHNLTCHEPNDQSKIIVKDSEVQLNNKKACKVKNLNKFDNSMWNNNYVNNEIGKEKNDIWTQSSIVASQDCKKNLISAHHETFDNLAGSESQLTNDNKVDKNRSNIKAIRCSDVNMIDTSSETSHNELLGSQKMHIRIHQNPNCQLKSAWKDPKVQLQIQNDNKSCISEIVIKMDNNIPIECTLPKKKKVNKDKFIENIISKSQELEYLLNNIRQDIMKIKNNQSFKGQDSESETYKDSDHYQNNYLENSLKAGNKVSKDEYLGINNNKNAKNCKSILNNRTSSTEYLQLSETNNSNENCKDIYDCSDMETDNENLKFKNLQEKIKYIESKKSKDSLNTSKHSDMLDEEHNFSKNNIVCAPIFNNEYFKEIELAEKLSEDHFKKNGIALDTKVSSKVLISVNKYKDISSIPVAVIQYNENEEVLEDDNDSPIYTDELAKTILSRNGFEHIKDSFENIALKYNVYDNNICENYDLKQSDASLSFSYKEDDKEVISNYLSRHNEFTNFDKIRNSIKVEPDPNVSNSKDTINDAFSSSRSRQNDITLCSKFSEKMIKERYKMITNPIKYYDNIENDKMLKNDCLIEKSSSQNSKMNNHRIEPENYSIELLEEKDNEVIYSDENKIENKYYQNDALKACLLNEIQNEIKYYCNAIKIAKSKELQISLSDSKNKAIINDIRIENIKSKSKRENAINQNNCHNIESKIIDLTNKIDKDDSFKGLNDEPIEYIDKVNLNIIEDKLPNADLKEHTADVETISSNDEEIICILTNIDKVKDIGANIRSRNPLGTSNCLNNFIERNYSLSEPSGGCVYSYNTGLDYCINENEMINAYSKIGQFSKFLNSESMHINFVNNFVNNFENNKHYANVRGCKGSLNIFEPTINNLYVLECTCERCIQKQQQYRGSICCSEVNFHYLPRNNLVENDFSSINKLHHGNSCPNYLRDSTSSYLHQQCLTCKQKSNCLSLYNQCCNIHRCSVQSTDLFSKYYNTDYNENNNDADNIPFEPFFNNNQPNISETIYENNTYNEHIRNLNSNTIDKTIEQEKKDEDHDNQTNYPLENLNESENKFININCKNLISQYKQDQSYKDTPFSFNSWICDFHTLSDNYFPYELIPYNVEERRTENNQFSTTPLDFTLSTEKEKCIQLIDELIEIYEFPNYTEKCNYCEDMRQKEQNSLNILRSEDFLAKDEANLDISNKCSEIVHTSNADFQEPLMINSLKSISYNLCRNLYSKFLCVNTLIQLRNVNNMASLKCLREEIERKNQECVTSDGSSQLLTAFYDNKLHDISNVNLLFQVEIDQPVDPIEADIFPQNLFKYLKPEVPVNSYTGAENDAEISKSLYSINFNNIGSSEVSAGSDSGMYLTSAVKFRKVKRRGNFKEHLDKQSLDFFTHIKSAI